jgi:mersacidin/lichenicidin family type 2 lantibiotic
MLLDRIIRAWKDPEYRLNLSAEEQLQLPENPAGAIELTDDELDMAVGGHRPSSNSSNNSSNRRSNNSSNRRSSNSSKNESSNSSHRSSNKSHQRHRRRTSNSWRRRKH